MQRGRNVERLGLGVLVALAMLALGCASGPTRDDASAQGIDPALEGLAWFVGLWRAGEGDGSGPRPVQYEHWQVGDDGSLLAANYQRVRGEVFPHQNMVLCKDRRGAVVLEVTGYEFIGNNAVPTPRPTYQLADRGADFARFDGPANALPRSILYQRGPQGELVISVVVPGEHGESEYFVAFARVAE